MRMANLFLGICCSISALILLGGWYVSRSWLEAMNSLTVLTQQSEILMRQEEKMVAWEAKLTKDFQELQDETADLNRREVDMEKVASSLSRTRAELELMSRVPPPGTFHLYDLGVPL